MTVSDRIIADLWRKGVRVIFGVVGGNAIHLSNAIARHKGIEFIAMHGEKDAGYAAIGYAKQTGSIGCAMVTTGCGSTNIITAVLSAYQDSVPLVVLAGQVPSHRRRGRGRQQGTQGASIEPMVRSITKGVAGWGFPESAASVVNLANTPRRGPVWISVPLDIQSSSLGPEYDTPGLSPN